MRVAVISSEELVGKSNTIILLASLFARTQRKRVTIFSTGDMTNILKSVETKTLENNLITSPPVFRAVLQSHDLINDELFDYAIRIGEEEVYAFNIWGQSIAEHELQELTLETLKRVNTPLVLVEVNGDLNSEYNKAVMENVDAYLYIFNTNFKSIENLQAYMKSGNRRMINRTGIICQKYNPKIISEKKLAALVGTAARNFLTIPYNAVYEKHALEGNLNIVAKHIANGNPEVVKSRIKLLEIMQWLFDSPKNKYILGIDKWYT